MVSRSLALDWDAPLFTAAPAPTVVITCAAADPVLRQRAEDAAEVVVAGDERVDVARAIAELGRRGAGMVLCEGGPRLLGEVVASGSLDELCITVAPLAVGGSGPRVAVGPTPVEALAFRLVSMIEDDHSLFLRYLRRP